MKLLGIEMSAKEFDHLMCEQNKGKELKVVDGEVVAVEHIVTEEELKEQRKFEIRERLSQLSQDFIQVWCGAELADVDARILEFQLLHNELRTLDGKEPRAYTHENPENTENTVDENS